jgi:hypothetical protein
MVGGSWDDEESELIDSRDALIMADVATDRDDLPQDFPGNLPLPNLHQSSS